MSSVCEGQSQNGSLELPHVHLEISLKIKPHGADPPHWLVVWLLVSVRPCVSPSSGTHTTSASEGVAQHSPVIPVTTETGQTPVHRSQHG